jgi:Amino acid permease
MFIGIAGSFALKHSSTVLTHWTPFIPPNAGQFGRYGWSGIARGVSVIFFAYIGFDALSTAAQESKNPQQDMPLGILGSLAICTLLYGSCESMPRPNVHVYGQRVLLAALGNGELIEPTPAAPRCAANSGGLAVSSLSAAEFTVTTMSEVSLAERPPRQRA